MTEQTTPTNSDLQRVLERHRATEEAIFTLSVVADRYRTFRQLTDDLNLLMAPAHPATLELEGAAWISELNRPDATGNTKANEITLKHEMVLTAAQEIRTALDLHQAALAEAGGIESIIQQKRAAYEAASELDHVLSVDPGVRTGKPCIRGLRISAYDVLDYLGCGMTRGEILIDYPDLKEEHIDACLSFATYLNGGVTSHPAP